MIHPINACPPTPQLPLLKSPEKELPGELTAKAEHDFELGEESFIICRNCGNKITTLANMTSMNGHHKHTFTNPAGIVFEIGCFSSAEGCVVVGEPTLDFTWFDGFVWSHALCSNCLLHMGWFYDSGLENFFGLILDNLLETTHTH